MERIWKVIEDYDDYEISNDAIIRDMYTGRELKTRYVGDSLKVNLKDEWGRYHQLSVLKLMVDTFLGKPPCDYRKYKVGFKDGDRSNITSDNLVWLENGISIGYNDLYINSSIRVVETGKIYDSIWACMRDMNEKESVIKRCLKNPKCVTSKGLHLVVHECYHRNLWED